MDASVIDLPGSGLTLSCVIHGGAAPLVGLLQTRLERSARVDAVERLDDALTLESVLALRHIDLVVHVLGAPDETLPACLLAHADVRVLVVAPEGAAGPLSHWLQQGANDVVAGDVEDGMSHALSRLLDECSLLATLRRQQTIIDTQRRRIEVLTDGIGSAPTAPAGPGAPSRSTVPGRPARAPRSARTARPVRIADAPAPSAEARGQAGSPGRADAGDRAVADQRPVGTRDGLPGRRLTLQRLDTLARLTTDEAHRDSVAVKLTFPFDEHGASRLERTLCDLTICRAVSAICRAVPQRLLLGRVHSATLLLLLCSDGEHAERDTEIALRRGLGTLGDLLERPEELMIETLSGPLSSLATQDLEARFEQERNATVASELTCAHHMLPMLTAHHEPFIPALAVVRS